MVQVSPAGANPFVSVQVPFEVSPGSVPVVITVNGVSSMPVFTQIVASQPGIFTLSANGQGEAVLVNLADDTIAAPAGVAAGSHPIPRGQAGFFYVTGLGAMTPAVADGSGICPSADSACATRTRCRPFRWAAFRRRFRSRDRLLDFREFRRSIL